MRVVAGLVTIATCLWLFWSASHGQDIRQAIPLPLPTGMGGTGNTTGSKSSIVTVGTLPTCNAASAGLIMMVTDSLLPALGVAVAAGGAVNVMVFCNGTNWIAG